MSAELQPTRVRSLTIFSQTDGPKGEHREVMRVCAGCYECLENRDDRLALEDQERVLHDFYADLLGKPCRVVTE